MTATKNCRLCGHKLSLHGGAEVVSRARAKKAPSADWFPEVASGRLRWWDGVQWGVYKDEWDRELRAREVLEVGEIRAQGGVSEELVKLVELHGRGVLTDEEFAVAKRRVLGV